MNKPVIGIDLGTTNSCVAVFNNKVEVIANVLGSRITPSCVSFDDNETIIGEGAKNQLGKNPENTVYGTKRLIGRDFDDPEVQHDITHFLFKVVNRNGKPFIQVQYKKEIRTLPPEEISAMVLESVKCTAEEYLGVKVEDVVITVPAYFNDSQRKATKAAGEIAGLNVLGIINEPTAAALAYGQSNNKDCKERNLLVYDLGGGTFDVSLVTHCKDVYEVRASDGDSHLGGEDFDNILVDYFASEFIESYPCNLKSDKTSMAKLRKECESAKRRLCASPSTDIEISSLYDGKAFKSKLSRAKFDELCGDLIMKTMNTVKAVIEAGGIIKSDVDEVLLVGGSTRIPMVQKEVAKFFEGTKISKKANADEVIAEGAAIQAHILSTEPRVVLLDVAPKSLGLKAIGDRMVKMIPKNLAIPSTNSKDFTTVSDYQTNLVVKVFEGENEVCSKNRLLGEFELSGIQRATKGEARIIVVFNVDDNGILKVSATESKTNKTKSLTITKLKESWTEKEKQRVSTEIEEFKRDRELHSAMSKEIEQEIYKIEHLLSAMNNVLTDPRIKSKIPAKIKRDIIIQIIDANKWLLNADKESLQTCKDKFSTLKFFSQACIPNGYVNYFETRKSNL